MKFLQDIIVNNDITAVGKVQSATLTVTGLSATSFNSVLVESAGVVSKRDLTLSLLPTGTEGQTLYNNAGTWTATSSLFWDDTNNRFGIGASASLAARLHVRGEGTTSSTFSGRFEDSAGTEIFCIRNDGLVSIRQRIPNATYGAELLTNPNFTSDLSGWTVGGADWTWVAGAATHAATGATTMSQLTVSTATHYRVKFSITKASGTNLVVSFGGVTLVTHTANVTTSYVYDVLTTATTGFVATPTSDFVGSLDTTSATIYTADSLAALTLYHTDGSTVAGEIRGGLTGNIGIGVSALLKTDAASTYNVAIGHSAMSASWYGQYNVAIGGNSGVALNNCLGNTLVGFASGQFVTTGNYNVGVGYGALYQSTTGGNNTAVGGNALRTNGSGSNSTAVGNGALYNSTAGGNTAFGVNAGYSLTNGTNNDFHGTNSGFSVTTGTLNVVLGTNAFYYPNLASSQNTAVGHQALTGTASNSINNNVALGYRAGYAVTTGSNNVLVGWGAGDNLTSGGTNIIIGYNLDAPAAASSNQLTLGNALFGVSIDGTGTTLSTGRLGAFVAAPTARLHLPAGTATASNAPLKFTAGTNLTTAEAGAMEWDGTNLYVTETTGLLRRTLTNTTYVQSRLENLVTNGSGLLSNNYNFSSWTYDQVETHGGAGSFKHVGVNTTKFNDEYIPVDPEKQYRMSLWAKAGNTGGGGYETANRQYAGVYTYDVDLNGIAPWMYMKHSGSTDTTLASPLNTGDLVVVLTDGTGWETGAGATYARQISWWGYTNAKGYTYPDYTYTRNGTVNHAYYNTNGAWNARATNTLTLTQAWPGPNLAAGTKVRNSTSGGTYKYITLSNVQVLNAWTRYEGMIGGWDTAGAGVTYLYPYGTAYVRLLFIANYAGTAAAIIRYSDIAFNEIESLRDGWTTHPALTFASDYSTGLYKSGAGAISVSCSGALTATIDSNGLTLVTGDKLRMPDNGAIYDTTGAIDRFTYSTNSVYNTRSSGLHVFQANGTTKVQIDSNGMMKLAGSTNAFGTAYLDFSNAAVFNTASTIYGVIGEIGNGGTGSTIGSRVMPRASQTGTMVYMAAYEAITRTIAAGTVVTSSYCYRALSPVITAGSIGTSYGLHIERQKLASGVTTGYGVYQADSNDTNYFAGATTFVGAVTAASFAGPLTGNAVTATTATNATNSGITNDTATNATMFPVWVTANTGNLPLKVTSTKLTYNPSTGALGVTGSITTGSITVSAGKVSVGGTNSGFQINRRDTSAAVWQWYSSAGSLELYDQVGAANKLVWTQAGTLTISSASTVFNGASGISVSGGASTLKASALGTAATYFAVFNGDPSITGTALVTRTATQVRADISAATSGAVTASGLTMSTARLLGRTTAATGAIEEISLANGTNCAATLAATTLTIAISGTPTFTDCTVTGRMNLPTSQPASPVNGSCYWDQATNKFWVYGTTYGWKSVTLT